METQHLRNYTQAQVESWYHQGVIGQDQWEGYMHAWATGTVRLGNYPGWVRHEFATPAAEAVAVELGCCKVENRG